MFTKAPATKGTAAVTTAAAGELGPRQKGSYDFQNGPRFSPRLPETRPSRKRLQHVHGDIRVSLVERALGEKDHYGLPAIVGRANKTCR